MYVSAGRLSWPTVVPTDALLIGRTHEEILCHAEDEPRTLTYTLTYTSESATRGITVSSSGTIWS